MNVSQEQHHDHLLVRLSGRLDTLSTKSFDGQMADVMSGSAGAIVIDMSDVDFVASAGLRSLLTTAKQLRVANRDLALSGLRPSVREVFDISGFSTILKIR